MTALPAQPLPPPPVRNRMLAPLFLALGVVCVGLGIVGMVLPGVPTTIFLIIALWAFARSSERLRQWLWRHPRFGAPVRDWHMHRVIPPRAKAAAVTMMALSVAIIAVASESGWMLPLSVAAVMVPVAIWIVTRRGHPPASPS